MSLSKNSRACLLRLLLVAAIGSGVAAVATPAAAQAWPTKPVHIIAPFGTGSILDQLARILGGHMSKALGQPVVVENVVGAGGVTGMAQMARAPKDGYTIAIVNNSFAINPSIYKKMPFDTVKDTMPIAIIGNTPYVLVVNPAVPANNLRELIALAKSKPDALSFGSSGNGSPLHLAKELMTSEAGIRIKHVPYKQSAQMLTDLIGGSIDMAMYSIPAIAAHIQSGKLRALGLSTQTRSGLLPAVPTFAEVGLPNYNFAGWLAFIAPSGTPKPVIDRLNAEIKAALALKEVQEALAKMDVATVDGSTEFATRFFASEMERNAQLVKTSGAALE